MAHAEVKFLDIDLEQTENRESLMKLCREEGWHIIWIEKNLHSDATHDFNLHMIILEKD